MVNGGQPAQEQQVPVVMAQTATTTTTTTATMGDIVPLDQLDASLDEFEPSIGNRPAAQAAQMPFGYHHHHPPTASAHSGFRSSSDVASEMDESESSEASAGGYSPPAWRRLGNGDRSSGFWRKGEADLAALFDGVDDVDDVDDDNRSRDTSPEYESADEGDDDILAQAIRTRLPTGSLSPERSPEPEYHNAQQQHTGDVGIKIKQEETDDFVLSRLKDVSARSKEVNDNCKTKTLPPGLINFFYKKIIRLFSLCVFRSNEGVGADIFPISVIRFAVRAEVQQRTEPIEMAINFVRGRFQAMTRSWTSMFASFLVAMFSYALLRWSCQPAAMRPVPDLVKVAGVARSLEPLIYYSENGIQQVGDLQATGVAVWDLSESVRTSNLTSAPIIVKELDELSESLKTLAIELTKFFANVDGDIDG